MLTSKDFTGILKANNFEMSIDKKGFRQGRTTYSSFFIQEHPHQSLARQTPNEDYFAARLKQAVRTQPITTYQLSFP
jgi:hypothetical protein